ncbi:hypothetical protein MICCA_1930006 [Microcystis aeruginosa PCC 9432]|uniref:Uncharacterized protein n=1 Tax=Microcystis aeruginosa PCC 9432 TaxID=1160280 RepID=A0A822L9Q8_MICAE|nr:hypothetical protein MICCA_1930006 [Microcystis aeruginosa PCC 9432]
MPKPFSSKASSNIQPNPIINPNLAKAAGQQAEQNQWPLSLLIS